VAPEPGPKYSGLDCDNDDKDDPCKWSETSYAALKSVIENSVPAGPRRDQKLRQIEVLEKPPYVADARSAKAWTDLAEKSARPAFNAQAKVIKKIGCAAEGAPYVIGGLVKQLYRLSDHNLLQEVVAAFLAGRFQSRERPESVLPADRALPTIVAKGMTASGASRGIPKKFLICSTTSASWLTYT
jgi:hypothetical protein